jgi:hypothetical protein
LKSFAPLNESKDFFLQLFQSGQLNGSCFLPRSESGQASPVYIIQDGYRYEIKDPSFLQSKDLTMNDVAKIDPILLDLIPLSIQSIAEHLNITARL